MALHGPARRRRGDAGQDAGQPRIGGIAKSGISF
jgi:hypothetical protein